MAEAGETAPTQDGTAAATAAPPQSGWSLSYNPQPSFDEFSAIYAALDAATVPVAGQSQVQPIAHLLRDEAGNIIGGLWARVAYGWCLIEMLVVPDALRGQGIGRMMMQRLEAEMRALGCIGMQVSTFEFQAPEFYQSIGFVAFGKLEDLPPGHATVWLAKRLD